MASPPGWNSGLRDQQGGDEAGGDQEDAHDHRGGGEQPPGAADPARRVGLGVAGVALHLRHHRDPGLEPGQAERELGEDQQRDADHHPGAGVVGGQRRRPVGDQRRGGDDVLQADDDHHDVQRQVDGDQDRPRCRWPR